MKKPINQRLMMFINYKNMNINSFSIEIKAVQSTINMGFERDSTPKIETLEKIFNTFVELNPMWLMFGKGEMLLTDNEIAINNPDNELIKAQIKKEVEEESKKLIDAYIKAAETMEKLNEYQEKEIVNLKEQLETCKKSRSRDEFISIDNDKELGYNIKD